MDVLGEGRGGTVDVVGEGHTAKLRFTVPYRGNETLNPEPGTRKGEGHTEKPPSRAAGRQIWFDP